MKKILWLLSALFIISIALILYFHKLDKIPSGFYVDEASVAYNSISIFETGRDEYGFSYPVAFRMMGSYSPPVFIYIASFLIKFFGSEAIVFRSISAVAILVSIFFFLDLLRKMDLYKFKLTHFVVLLFYSISPWMVFNARLGYETTLGFLVFNIGVYFLFRSLSNPINLIWGTLALSFSTYVSHNQRFLSPLILIFFLIFFWKTIVKKKNFKIVAISFFSGIITQIPNLTIIFTPAFWIKSGQFNINYFWKVITYLSPRTLFYQNPDIDMQHTIPKISMLFNWMSIPYLAGLYLMARKLKEPKYKFLIFYFVVTLIPSVFSSQFVSSQRVLPFAIPLLIVIGLGIDRIFLYIKPAIRYILLIVVFCYSLLSVYTSYFVLFPIERAHGWNYGYDQVANYIKSKPEVKFLFDDTRNPRSYILLLYFLKISPLDYQKVVDPIYRDNYYSAYDPATYYQLENVEVRSINWEIDPKREIYVIGDEFTVSANQMQEHKLSKVTEFMDLQKNINFVVYKTSIVKN